jgi:hypothetical protein
MSQLIDALELIAERCSHATICLKVRTAQEVDALYAEIGPTCDDSGKRIAKESVPPEWDDQQGMRWRTAVVTVAGVRCIINGPFEVRGGRKAA